MVQSTPQICARRGLYHSTNRRVQQSQAERCVAGVFFRGECTGAAAAGGGVGRRWNATGNRFQEGRGPLPCRISPAVKRADKCGGHLRQQRCDAPPARAPPGHPPRPSLHSKRHWLRNQSDGRAAFYPHQPGLLHPQYDAFTHTRLWRSLAWGFTGRPRK